MITVFSCLKIPVSLERMSQERATQSPPEGRFQEPQGWSSKWSSSRASLGPGAQLGTALPAPRQLLSLQLSRTFCPGLDAHQSSRLTPVTLQLHVPKCIYFFLHSLHLLLLNLKIVPTDGEKLGKQRKD